MKNLLTLPQVLDSHARDDRFITFIEGAERENSVSFAQLRERALGLLHFLQKSGLRAGTELIIHLNHNQAFVDMFWAAMYGKIVPVPLAPGIRDEHKAKLFKVADQLRRPALFTDRETYTRLQNYARDKGLMADWEELSQACILLEDIPQLDQMGKIQAVEAEDLAFVQFSSGSTGEPKGVQLTHANLMANMEGIVRGAKLHDADVSLSWMPLTHDMGLIGFHLTLMLCQASQYILPTELFVRRPRLWMQKVSEKKATLTCSPNFGYQHFLNAFQAKAMEGMDLRSLRLIFNGAEPISLKIAREFLDTLAPYGLKSQSMFPVYGLAEASLAVAFSEVEAEVEVDYLNRKQMGLGDFIQKVDADHPHAFPIVREGKAVYPGEFGIFSEQGQRLGENTIGLVWIRGANVTAGYYGQAELNRRSITPEGWLNTGDLGFVSQGNLSITGRYKDIIFLNGQNIYPHDLERILESQNLAETGKVAVAAHRQEDAAQDEILVFMIHKGKLENFVEIAPQVKVAINRETALEVSQVLPIRQLPKTTSGKIERYKLVEAYREGEFQAVTRELESLLTQKSPDQEDISPSLIERQIKEICDTFIPDTSLGIEENIFEAGTSSLTLSQIHEKIDEFYPDVLELEDYFEYPSIREIAQVIMEKLGQNSADLAHS